VVLLPACPTTPENKVYLFFAWYGFILPLLAATKIKKVYQTFNKSGKNIQKKCSASSITSHTERKKPTHNTPPIHPGTLLANPATISTNPPTLFRLQSTLIDNSDNIIALSDDIIDNSYNLITNSYHLVGNSGNIDGYSNNLEYNSYHLDE
jgi:hypothetical protein